MNKNYQKGFIKTALIFIVALIAIEYFDIDVTAIVESDTVQSLIGVVKGLFTNYVEPGLETVKDALPEGVVENAVGGAVENATSPL